ncbi:MAG: hypothetical protein OXU77_07065 [Gammaproteobacteria bacterium]|nr:hypothetical protein [Gammaproteobacteria bacterium]MDE0442326.1 hypothetical protein [Gammaproteobacteria bacterium]
MATQLPKLIATSVVRGTQQGESHGGVYTVDFDQREVVQHVDWNTGGIDFEGRGADRGLRGIEFHEDSIFIAASDELFRYDRDFKIQASYRNRYLKHCHEICRRDQTILLTSTGFDSLLAFDLAQGKYVWGFHLQRPYDEWGGHTFDPRSNKGPRPVNAFHINMVHVDGTGIFFSGLHTRAMLHLDSSMEVTEVCSLPAGAHNARPYRNGVLFNDTETDCVRYAGRNGEGVAFKIITYHDSEIEFAGIDDSKVARQGFGRGLCAIGERFVAAGSSPSTISLYDIEANQKVGSVNLTMDIRNAIHGLEVWPFG